MTTAARLGLTLLVALLLSATWASADEAGTAAATLASGEAVASGESEAAGEAVSAGEPVSFSRQIAPILVQRCLGCHGPEDPQGEYQLHNFESLVRPGYSASPVVTAGEPRQSELYLLVATDDESLRMPSGGDPLPAEEIALIEQWIQAGATYDAEDPGASLAAVIPAQRHPAPPLTYRAPLPVTALAFSADGSRLFSSGYHELLVWDVASGSLLERWDDLPQRIQDIALDPSGKYLAVAGGTPGISGEVRLLNAATGQTISTLVRSEDLELSVAFSTAGDRLATGGANRAIRVFSIPEGVPEILIEEHADWVLDVAWSADGTRLASASRDKTAKLFDATTGSSLLTYPGHREVVYSVGLLPDGSQVLSSGRDRKIQLWKTADAGKAAEIGGFRRDIHRILIQGDQLYSAAADGGVRQHKLEDRALVREFSKQGEWVYSLAVDPAAARVAAGSFAGQIRVWNTADGSLLKEWTAVPPAEAAAAAE